MTCIKVGIQIKFFGNNKTQAVAARFISTEDCINNFCFQTGKFTRLSLSSLNKSTFPSDFKTQDRFKSSICRLAASSSPVSNKSLNKFKESAHIFICRRRARVAVECAYLLGETAETIWRSVSMAIRESEVCFARSIARNLALMCYP